MQLQVTPSDFRPRMHQLYYDQDREQTPKAHRKSITQLTTSLFPYMQKFVLFSIIGILYRQNAFSMHSSLHVQEEQINMPEQNLQNLNNKPHFQVFRHYRIQ